MVANYLYRKSDGMFIWGGTIDVTLPEVNGVPNEAEYGIASFADADRPDLKLHRFDSSTGKRLATSEELVAAATEELTEAADRDRHRKDILTICALIVKRSNPTAWSNMSPLQKKKAVLAAADDYRDLRVLVDKFV